MKKPPKSKPIEFDEFKNFLDSTQIWLLPFLLALVALVVWGLRLLTPL